MARPPAVQETLDQLTEQLGQLPDEDRAQFIQVATRFSGPLPPPEDLKMYEDTITGLGDRIATMAEKALDAEIADAARARSNERLRLYGSIAAAFALLGVAALAMLLNNGTVAIFLGLGGPFAGALYYLFDWLRVRDSSQ